MQSERKAAHAFDDGPRESKKGTRWERKMSEKQSGFTPPPEVGPRLRIDRNGNYVDEFGRRVDDRSTALAAASMSSARAFAELVAIYVVDKVQKNIANLIQTAQETMLSDNLFCAI